MLIETNDLLHYIAVYGVLLLSWTSVMDYFGGNITYTAVAVFVIFILADKIAHGIFKI